MAPIHDLGIPHERLNVNGGALALRASIGASGARLIVTLLRPESARRQARRGVAVCIGGGRSHGDRRGDRVKGSVTE